MPATSENIRMQHFLCEHFWQKPGDNVVRIYALALAQLVHNVLQEKCGEFWLSDRDLENSDKLWQALQNQQSDDISTMLKIGGISPRLRRFVICIMRRLANMHARKDIPDNERFPWVGQFYSFLKRPDILDTGGFFPVDEMVFFDGIIKKKK